jgi:hypothetical protein
VRSTNPHPQKAIVLPPLPRPRAAQLPSLSLPSSCLPAVASAKEGLNCMPAVLSRRSPTKTEAAKREGWVLNPSHPAHGNTVTCRVIILVSPPVLRYIFTNLCLPCDGAACGCGARILGRKEQATDISDFQLITWLVIKGGEGMTRFRIFTIDRPRHKRDSFANNTRQASILRDMLKSAGYSFRGGI